MIIAGKDFKCITRCLGLLCCMKAMQLTVTIDPRISYNHTGSQHTFKVNNKSKSPKGNFGNQHKLLETEEFFSPIIEAVN